MTKREDSWAYGRQKIRNYAQERDLASQPSCAKCRRLRTGDDGAFCGSDPARALDAAECGEYSDCSRQRDYFPHFYHHDMRR
jgi:hypothetical protein